jgi:hypothetical protein
MQFQHLLRHVPIMCDCGSCVWQVEGFDFAAWLDANIRDDDEVCTGILAATVSAAGLPAAGAPCEPYAIVAHPCVALQ